jgi:hypothetical protein
MHMAHVGPHADRLQLVLGAMNETDTQRRRKMLHKLFDGYGATSDFPGFWFFTDLMDMYPDAAIILNTRNGGGAAWYKSFAESIGFFYSLTFRIICFPYATDRLHYKIHEAAEKTAGDNLGVSLSPAMYETHNERVRTEARKRGRPVLEWKAEDGWGPICKFLGKPEPPKDVSFPRLNDKKTMTILKTILVTRGLLTWAAIFGAAYAGYAYFPQIADYATAFVARWRLG